MQEQQFLGIKGRQGFRLAVTPCEKGALAVAGLEAGGMRQRLEAKTGKKTDFSLEPPGEKRRPAAYGKR